MATFLREPIARIAPRQNMGPVTQKVHRSPIPHSATEAIGKRLDIGTR